MPAVVIFTGSGSERVAVEAMKAGAHDYLLKEGFSPERLRHGLHNAVEAVRMVRELEERRAQTELRRQLPTDVRSRSVESRLEQILRGAQRMGELIDHFLEVTRGGERLLRRSRVDLFALVRAKVRELGPLAATHPVQLHVEGMDFQGLWDEAGLERALDNLLSNAVKYSPKGGTIDVWLVEESSGPEGWVRLSVEDKGMGIPQTDLPHIFERFHRGGKESRARSS